MFRWPAALGAALALVAAPASAGAPPAVTYSSPVWSPNGKQIAFVATRDPSTPYGDIYVANADGTNVRRVTHEETGKTGLAWSPNGKWIAYQSYAYIDEVSPDGTQHRRLTRYGGMQPDFSPSGRRIAFANAAAEFYAFIAVMRPDGKNQVVAAKPHGDETLTNPTWSPDGQRLAFTVGTAADSNFVTPYLAVIDQYRGRRTKYAVGHLCLSTDWAPRGNRVLVVESTRHGNGYEDWRISVLDLRTKKLHYLHQHATYTARWSPDGKRILFENGGRLFVMNADGSHVRDVTPA
jgi:Tol biopolymer transport system component